MNCWIYKKCKSKHRDKCNAFLRNKGKRCWQVTGTKCEGMETFETLTSKIEFCRSCDFYIKYADKF